MCDFQPKGPTPCEILYTSAGNQFWNQKSDVKSEITPDVRNHQWNSWNQEIMYIILLCIMNHGSGS